MLHGVPSDRLRKSVGQRTSRSYTREGPYGIQKIAFPCCIRTKEHCQPGNRNFHLSERFETLHYQLLSTGLPS